VLFLAVICRVLNSRRDRCCCFNDDMQKNHDIMQGTAAGIVTCVLCCFWLLPAGCSTAGATAAAASTMTCKAQQQ
jgi:hypothetical protein